MKTNVRAVNKNRTFGGGPAAPGTYSGGPLKELERTVTSCLLFEKTFYEGADNIAKRINDLVAVCDPQDVSQLAIRTRNELGLRHVSLWLARCLARHHTGSIVGYTINLVIQRADELSEYVSLYWRDKRQPLNAQSKKGLAKAFGKFNAYKLAKYNRSTDIKLRDVLFLCHAKAENEEQDKLWKQLINDTLPVPDTWEVALSSGADKRTTWKRLLKEEKLGGLALLRNLRNMQEVGISQAEMEVAIAKATFKGVLPFQFISAAKHAPRLEEALSKAAIATMSGMDKLPGRTLLIVDVSGSMCAMLSDKSTLNRIDAACGQAMLVRGVCESPVLYATGGNDYTRVHATEELPARQGFALGDEVRKRERTLGGGGIFLYQCMDYIAKNEHEPFDRVIVFTDEQDCDLKRNAGAAVKLGKYNYINNIATYKPCLDTSNGWTRVNGFSERLVEWIRVYENLES